MIDIIIIWLTLWYRVELSSFDHYKANTSTCTNEVLTKQDIHFRILFSEQNPYEGRSLQLMSQ